MRITFVLPFAAETGGVRAILRFADGLKQRGHAVQVVAPFIPFRFYGGFSTAAGRRVWFGTLARNLIGWGAPIMQESAFRVRFLPTITVPFVPDADVIVATAWPTAYAITRLPARAGVRVYYVFHREIDVGPPEVVDASYRLPMFRTALSHATERSLAEECGVSVDDITPVGVDADYWGASPAVERRGVLMMWGGTRKGGEDGMEVLSRLHAARPDEPIVLFGSTAPDRLPDGFRFVRRPDDETLRRLYHACRVFLYPSRQEGFGMPPLEAMAAGCAVVTTPVGAVPDYSRDGTDAIWAPVGDHAAMTRAVIALLDDPARCDAIARAARESARRFDWESATERLEATLLRAARATTASG